MDVAGSIRPTPGTRGRPCAVEVLEPLPPESAPSETRIGGSDSPSVFFEFSSFRLSHRVELEHTIKDRIQCHALKFVAHIFFPQIARADNLLAHARLRINCPGITAAPARADRLSDRRAR